MRARLTHQRFQTFWSPSPELVKKSVEKEVMSGYVSAQKVVTYTIAGMTRNNISRLGAAVHTSEPRILRRLRSLAYVNVGGNLSSAGHARTPSMCRQDRATEAMS